MDKLYCTQAKNTACAQPFGIELTHIATILSLPFLVLEQRRGKDVGKPPRLRISYLSLRFKIGDPPFCSLD
ncbi:MAG: hypothetical protein ACRC9N_11110 [Aeromonas sp.]